MSRAKNFSRLTAAASRNAKVIFSLLLISTFSWAANPYVNNIGETIDLQVGQEYFISTEDLQVRSSPQATPGNVVGKVSLNDIVLLVQQPAADSVFMAVKIKGPRAARLGGPDQIFYVSKGFVSAAEIMKRKSPYFVIQNVATEMTRVYKRCETSVNCPHQMVFETKMVVGRPEEGTDKSDTAFLTSVGHARISEWVKFYQDGRGHYPHWYKAGQNLQTIPPKAPLNSKGQPTGTLSWGQKWRVKQNGEETMYGAFGWYAAKLYPANAVNAQWIHGTIGWGSDGEAAIELTRSMLLNIFSNPGSAGCTRLSNGAVAYLRHLVPAGTDVYRVYAREATRENPCGRKSLWGTCSRENIFAAYSSQTQPKPWPYVMVTDGAQKSGGVSADHLAISRLGIIAKDGVNVIERGVYNVDQYPNAAVSDYRYEASSGRTGDRYQIDDPTGNGGSRFVGHFLVDEGRFVNYAHPSSERVVIGGLPAFRQSVPEELKTSGSFAPAEIVYKDAQSASVQR